jgi:hypothetical protein
VRPAKPVGENRGPTRGRVEHTPQLTEVNESLWVRVRSGAHAGVGAERIDMEVSSSAVTGALRVGLQVVSSHKRPMLEVYYQMRNRFGPEYEYQMPGGSSGKETITQKTRFQDIFVEFTLVNIGGMRAENIKLTIQGDLKRNKPREAFGDKFNHIIPQMAPGQTHYLFRFDDHDLDEYPEGGGSPLGMKKQSFTINIEYDARKGPLNWILSLPSMLRKKRRFRDTYTFSPPMVAGDLPPAEYAP